MEADCLTLGGGGRRVTSSISFRMPNLPESLPVNRTPSATTHHFLSIFSRYARARPLPTNTRS